MKMACDKMTTTCVPLTSVRNLSVDDIRIEIFNSQTNKWTVIIPNVMATTNYQPHNGLIWLPKGSVARSVNNKTNEQKTIFGVVDEHPDILQG
jgi:hypothetical protein